MAEREFKLPDLDDRLVEGDGVALGDQPAHDVTLGEPFAEVGKLELALRHLAWPPLS